MKRFLLRALVAGALAGSGLVLMSSAASAATCTPTGQLGDVVVGGVGSIDPELGGTGNSLCVEVAGRGIYIAAVVLDASGANFDNWLFVCVFAAADTSYCSNPATARFVNIGVSNADLAETDVTVTSGCLPTPIPCPVPSPANGIAIELLGDPLTPTIRVVIDGNPYYIEIPRLCVEVGAEAC